MAATATPSTSRPIQITQLKYQQIQTQIAAELKNRTAKANEIAREAPAKLIYRGGRRVPSKRSVQSDKREEIAEKYCGWYILLLQS